jgi:L(+)-tartrate dehydratase alpha subunit
MISQDILYQVGCELNLRAAVSIPTDVKQIVTKMAKEETAPKAKFALEKMVENYEKAAAEKRPMCSDTGLPRFYVKCGNSVEIDGGFTGLEHMLRKATADSTKTIPLRPNRVDPIFRTDNNNNVGAHAPSVDYSFEPDADWIDITAVHKGGLFGADYRMLFPSDGIDGIKRFFFEVLSQFFRRGMSCQPATIGIGIGGAKDTCVKLAKEAACLRIVGDRHPKKEIANLEEELVSLGNKSGFGIMGLAGTRSVMDVHIETAYAHTGGMPISIQHFCLAQRRSTARVYDNNRIEFRDNPNWFTDYYRRETVQ